MVLWATLVGANRSRLWSPRERRKAKEGGGGGGTGPGPVSEAYNAGAAAVNDAGGTGPGPVSEGLFSRAESLEHNKILDHPRRPRQPPPGAVEAAASGPGGWESPRSGGGGGGGGGGGAGPSAAPGRLPPLFPKPKSMSKKGRRPWGEAAGAGDGADREPGAGG